jgi:hypothetical protein
MAYSDSERGRVLSDRKMLSVFARQISVPMIMFRGKRVMPQPRFWLPRFE